MTSSDFLTPPAWIKNAESLRDLLLLQQSESLLIEDYLDLDNPGPFLTGLKQFYYWRRQLASSVSQNTIVIAFLGKEGLAPINVLEVCIGLKSICDMENVVEVFQGAHTRLMGISFSSVVDVRKITEGFRFFKGAIVSFVFSTTSEYADFRLLWLPPLFQPELITHLLNKYFETHTLVRERTKIDENKYANTNVVRGRVKFKKDMPIEKLPHLIKLPFPHKGSALLMLDGREAMCLRCRAVGHLRKKCLATKCVSCKSFHPPDSACPANMYSTRAAGKLFSEQIDDWLEHAEDAQDPGPSRREEVVVGKGNFSVVPIDPSKVTLAPQKSYSKSFPVSCVVQKDPFLFVDSPEGVLVEDETKSLMLKAAECELQGIAPGDLICETSAPVISDACVEDVEDVFFPPYIEQSVCSPAPEDNEGFYDSLSSTFPLEQVCSGESSGNVGLFEAGKDVSHDISSSGSDSNDPQMEVELPTGTARVRKRRRPAGGRKSKKSSVSVAVSGVDVGNSSRLDEDSSSHDRHKLLMVEKQPVMGHDPPEI